MAIEACEVIAEVYIYSPNVTIILWPSYSENYEVHAKGVDNHGSRNFLLLVQIEKHSR